MELNFTFSRSPVRSVGRAMDPVCSHAFTVVIHCRGFEAPASQLRLPIFTIVLAQCKHVIRAQVDVTTLAIDVTKLCRT